MQVVSTLQHLLRLEPGCRLVDFGAGACKLASQLYRSDLWTSKICNYNYLIKIGGDGVGKREGEMYFQSL